MVLFDPAYMSKEVVDRLGFGPLGLPSTAEGMAKSVEAAKGTTGSPTKASREKGKEYHEHLVARPVEVVEQLRRG